MKKREIGVDGERDRAGMRFDVDVVAYGAAIPHSAPCADDQTSLTSAIDIAPLLAENAHRSPT
jgi:hypothetical protein